MTLTDLAQRLSRAGQREAAAYVEHLRTACYGRPLEASALDPLAASSGRRALRRALAYRSGPAGRLRALRALPPRSPAGPLRALLAGLARTRARTRS